jgi:hypothetical protein
MSTIVTASSLLGLTTLYERFNAAASIDRVRRVLFTIDPNTIKDEDESPPIRVHPQDYNAFIALTYLEIAIANDADLSKIKITERMLERIERHASKLSISDYATFRGIASKLEQDSPNGP